MGKKETFEKMTTTQFLLMQLRRCRGKEIEAEFASRREQGRVLALLKMADAQSLDDMSVVLGIAPEALSEVVVGLEAAGLVSVEGAQLAASATDAAAQAEPLENDEAAMVAADDEAADDELAADEAPVEDEDAEPASADSEQAGPADGPAADAPEEPSDEDEAFALLDELAAPAPEPVPAVVCITDTGRAWVQPPVDLPGMLLEDFGEDELEALDASLDKLVSTLEGACGATAAQMMEEEKKRREETAAHRERGGRDGRRDDRDSRGRDSRGGRGDFKRDGGRDGRGGFGRDRDDRGFGRGKGGFGRDSRGGKGGFGRDSRGDRDRGGFGRDSRDGRKGFGRDGGRDDRGFGRRDGFGR